MNSVAVLVAVRLKSQRLPRKALLDLSGEPLIVRLTERVMTASIPKKVVWCTSVHSQDDPLEQLANERCIPIFRGAEDDVMGRFLDAASRIGATTVIRVTGDNPLSDPELMDLLITSHFDLNAEYSYNDQLPRGTRCEVIDVKMLEKCHERLQDPNSSEYMTLQLRRPDVFKVNRVHCPDVRLHRPEMRLTVDTKEDYELLSSIYKHYQGNVPKLIEVVEWLDLNPQVRDLNFHIEERRLGTDVNVKLKGDAGAASHAKG